MQDRVKLEPAPGTRGGERRRRILKGLHDCVIEQGYAKTTLADVARSADMSPSHLLYYFSGKNAILKEYFERVAARIRERIDGFRGEDVRHQIELLAELFFAGKGITRSEIGFMLECFGVAVHDPQLHREKTELDQFCKAYLKELFEHLPDSGAAKDAAEVAYAILIGLRTAAYFDQRLGLPQARRLFRAEMSTLAGIDEPG